jgi:capsular polysaccharide biosynthesis protein
MQKCKEGSNMEEESTLDLAEFWEIIKKNSKLILLITIIATLFTGFLSYFVIPKTYEARTSIIIGLDVSDSEYNDKKIQYNDVLMYKQMIKTYAEIAKQDIVSEKTIKTLGIEADTENFQKNITITPQPDTQIIILKFKNKSPEEAQKIANTFTDTFVEEARRLNPGGSIQIMDNAKVPKFPVSPRPKLNTAIAFVLGILISLGIVFLREYMDDTIKTEEDVEKYLNIPVIGIIPNVTEDIK